MQNSKIYNIDKKNYFQFSFSLPIVTGWPVATENFILYNNLECNDLKNKDYYFSIK